MKKMFMLGLLTLAASSVNAEYYSTGYYSQGAYYQPGYQSGSYYYQPGYQSGAYYQPGYQSNYYQPNYGYGYQDGTYYQPGSSSQSSNLYIPETGCPSGQQQYQNGYNGYPQDMNHPQYRNEDDRQLHKNIMNAIQGRYNVQAFVDNGNVTLQGMVRSQDERRELEDKVRNMNGVRNLNSQLMIQGEQHDRSGMMRPTDRSRDNWSGRDQTDMNRDANRTGADADVAKKVRDELSSYDNVSVQINNGEVTLRGTVDSQNDKDKIEKKLRSIRGVRNVNNQITVRGTNGTSRGY